MDEPATDKKFSAESTHTKNQLKAIIAVHPSIRFSRGKGNKLHHSLLDESEREFSKIQITANSPTFETYGSIVLKITTRASVERDYIISGHYESTKRLKKDFYGFMKKVEKACRRKKILRFKKLRYIARP